MDLRPFPCELTSPAVGCSRSRLPGFFHTESSPSSLLTSYLFIPLSYSHVSGFQIALKLHFVDSLKFRIKALCLLRHKGIGPPPPTLLLLLDSLCCPSCCLGVQFLPGPCSHCSLLGSFQGPIVQTPPRPNCGAQAGPFCRAFCGPSVLPGLDATAPAPLPLLLVLLWLRPRSSGDKTLVARKLQHLRESPRARGLAEPNFRAHSWSPSAHSSAEQGQRSSFLMRHGYCCPCSGHGAQLAESMPALPQGARLLESAS